MPVTAQPFAGPTASETKPSDMYSVAKQMTFPGRVWQKASPESQEIDSKKLEAAMKYLDTHAGGVGASEAVVIRNGYLIWQGKNSNAYHEIYSCTKTFTTTLLGLLVKDKKCALDSLAVDYRPSLDDIYQDYGKITFRQLATMTSGYDGDKGDRANPNTYLTPGAPMYTPGTSFKYHDPAVHLLGSLITRIAGESLRDLFKRRVADPIGMARWDWRALPDAPVVNGIVLTNPAGTPWKKNGGGVYTTPIDLARYGLLYLNRGNWNGRQIIPAWWVDQAGAAQVSASVQTRHFDLCGRYGFMWWTNGLKRNGKRSWPNAPPGTYTAYGASRNFCFVIPEWNMVIVRMDAKTSMARSSAKTNQIWNQFFGILTQAVGPQSVEPMVFPGKNWREASPESQQVDSDGLDKALNYIADFTDSREGVTRAVVIRNGYMIWKGSHIDTPECVFSVSKAFAGTVLGHLIDSGKCGLNTLAGDYVSLLTDDYAGITLRHFTTMTSGYNAEGPEWKKDGLCTPLRPVSPQFAPGTKVFYNDHAMRMFGYVLTRIAGTDLDTYFRRHIARPIGIKDASCKWQTYMADLGCRFDFDNSDRADVRDAGGGVWVTAEALARLGHLYLNRGCWSGKQILSADWVDAATTVQVPLSTPVYGRRGIMHYGASLQAAGRQGYNWWANSFGIDGKRMWPDAPPRTYAAIGAHHNWCWVIPEWKMVVVRIGRHNPHYLGNFDKRYEKFFTLLSQAVNNTTAKRK